MSQPIQTIIARTAEAFGVPVSEIVSERRSRGIVLPRHVAMTLARDLTPASYPRIAKAFQRFDHSTVMHAERRTRERMTRDPDLAAKVAALRECLRQEVTS